MRRSLFVMLGILVMMGTLVAQTHDNATEKKVTDVISFTTDVRIGTVMLQAGSYRVSCDTKTMTFTRLVSGKDQEWVATLDALEQHDVQGAAKALEVECKGKHLTSAADNTVMSMSTDTKGVKVLDKLLLKGSNVEHTFN